MSKSMFFTLDALFATMLIGVALFLSSSYFISDSAGPQTAYYSGDIIECLSGIKIGELNDTYVQSLISAGEIINLDNSIIEQIGEFYVLNKTIYAEDLAVIATSRLIPDKYGIEILVNGETIYSNSTGGAKSELVSSRRLISGIEKFKPLRGATSKVFLQGINKKKFSSYLYFGGFVGQGNITGYIDDIPAGVNISGMYMEADPGADFDLYINKAICGTTFSAGTGTMTADGWEISHCNSSIIPGAKNNFTIDFAGELGSAFLGGGFIRVDYFTSKMQEEPAFQVLTEPLPEINGVINLYSSFYIPGTLSNISIFLHYYVDSANQTNNTFYFTLGNATLFKDNNLTGEKNHTITANNVSSLLPLSSLNMKTIPIRAGFENVSFGYIFEGNADVALITDVSGSMRWRMDWCTDSCGSGDCCAGIGCGSSACNGVQRSCNDPLLNNSNTERLSVAKCLDKQFSADILNISGNRAGLIAYESSTQTSRTIYPTTNFNQINSTISSYTASGSTCICCGINSAKSILTANISSITLVASGSLWRYNNFSLKEEPGQDAGGNNWFDYTYSNESQWFSGNAILGASNAFSYSPYILTEIGSDLAGSSLYPNMWKREGDNPGPIADFSSGLLNTTGTDYGLSGADDGWDKDPRDGSGPFGYDDDIDYNNIVGGRLDMDNNFGGSGNTCSGRDCSGAYGIKLNITQEMYDTMVSGGSATVSFWYEWADRSGNYFENCDQVWIKARWTSSSGSTYLGSNLDTGHIGADATLEVWTTENPDNSYSGEFMQDITSLISGPGYYYLELGGKLLADTCNLGDSTVQEYGNWRFDNIMVIFSNITDNYYFRKNFTINDIAIVKKGVLNILSDDRAIIYLNGYIIDDDPSPHNGSYWNRRGKTIPGEYFVQGNNVIAAKLVNSNMAAKFDIELIGINESRELAMMVMTDGQANAGCAEQGTTGDLDGDGTADTASDDAIQAACTARQEYGINVYAVGYSVSADEPTLQGIALCGEGIYTKSDNVTILEEFYQDVASSIISASRHSQTIEIEGSGDISQSKLYGDSYIKIEYTPVSPPPQFGEISLIIEEKNFGNCSFQVYIPPNIRVSDARVTSYSSEHWTDGLIANNNPVYNLSMYSADYTALGDPFIVNIPASHIVPGNNTFSIRTGDSPYNSTDCSKNNSFIYTAQVRASISYSDVLENAIGCKWFIEFDDGENTTINVPPQYGGTKQCYYRQSSIDFDINDTYDDAMYRLLASLDFDNDGRIYVNIKENNLFVGAISVGKVPYPWGPAIAEVRVWR